MILFLQSTINGYFGMGNSLGQKMYWSQPGSSSTTLGYAWNSTYIVLDSGNYNNRGNENGIEYIWIAF